MLECKNISKSYKDVPLFKRLNYRFEDGKAYALVGKNGSGKSVLLRLLAGFSVPDQGQILVDGKPLGEGQDFLPDAGISINQPEFVDSWSGWENLCYLARIQRKVEAKVIMDWVRRFEMEGAIKRRYKGYSQGMRQKLRLIQALMEEPKYLLLDEPFNALDEDSVDLLREILRAYKQPGRCLIFTSHDREDIEAVADVVLPLRALKRGELVQDETQGSQGAEA